MRGGRREGTNQDKEGAGTAWRKGEKVIGGECRGEWKIGLYEEVGGRESDGREGRKNVNWFDHGHGHDRKHDPCHGQDQIMSMAVAVMSTTKIWEEGMASGVH